jgi:SH3-like domain-containing protein
VRYSPLAALITILGTTCLSSITCEDASAEIKSGKCPPRYVSLKYARANSHVGPGKDYKVRYVYIVSGLPMLIIAKYDTWYYVVDPDGEKCWVHKSMLSSKRFVIISYADGARIYRNSNDSSLIVALAKKNVVLELRRIRGNWCEVALKYKGHTIEGWIHRSLVYGVSDGEKCL